MELMGFSKNGQIWKDGKDNGMKNSFSAEGRMSKEQVIR